MNDTIRRSVDVEEYEPIEIVVIQFDSEDVIRTSGGDDGEWDICGKHRISFGSDRTCLLCQCN